MPLYEFFCDDPLSPYYKKPFTLLVSYKEYEEQKDTLKCPITGKPLKMRFGSVKLNFKGSGFYANDK